MQIYAGRRIGIPSPHNMIIFFAYFWKFHW